MIEPKASHAFWPDALEKSPEGTAGLKPWSGPRAPREIPQLLDCHHAARPPASHAGLGIWWQDAFWFSTGPRTRKAKNIAADPHVVIGTEKADEAVILEGLGEEIKDRSVWKQLVQIYNTKYGGDVEPFSCPQKAASSALSRRSPSGRTSMRKTSLTLSPVGIFQNSTRTPVAANLVCNAN